MLRSKSRVNCISAPEANLGFAETARMCLFSSKCYTELVAYNNKLRIAPSYMFKNSWFFVFVFLILGSINILNGDYTQSSATLSAGQGFSLGHPLLPKRILNMYIWTLAQTEHTISAVHFVFVNYSLVKRKGFCDTVFITFHTYY